MKSADGSNPCMAERRMAEIRYVECDADLRRRVGTAMGEVAERPRGLEVRGYFAVRLL